MNWTRRPKKQAILGKKHAGFFLLSHHRLRRRPAPAPCSATFLSLPCCDRARSTAALFRSTKKGGGLAHEGHKSERARERERERRVSFFCLFFFFDSALFSFSLSPLSLGNSLLPKERAMSGYTSTWVQCDNPGCLKWRRISRVAAEALGEQSW